MYPAMEVQPHGDPFASITARLESCAGTKVGGGRYSLVRILGRGGMSIVWLARDERLDCEVALKFLPPQIRYDEAALDDLRRETVRSHKLTHPNIVRVHDFCEVPGEDAFISMEYVEGRNLAELRVEQAARVFSWDFLKPVVEQLCSALDYAHGERIVHRDLKPANVMLDSRGRVKLADFGIARAVNDTMIRISMAQTSGTLLYMSPQQAEGRQPQPSDDIYALGAILYELLTGKPPFYTGDIAHQVRNVAPTPLRERLGELAVADDVPIGIEQLIMACLSKNVADRPRSAADIGRRISGEKLKIVETAGTHLAHGVAQRRKRTSAATLTWTWAVISGLACGACVWAVADFVQAKARARGRESTIVASSDSSAVAPDRISSEKVSANAPSPSVDRVALAPESKITTSAAAIAPPPSFTTTPAPAAETASVVASPRVIELRGNQANRPMAATPSPAVANAPGAPAASMKASAAPSAATALQLLRKGNAHVPSRSKNHVLQMVSERTALAEPPQIWRILFHDDKARYNAIEVRFKNGDMDRMFEPNRILDLFSFGPPKLLDLQKVKIDSDEAIRIALSASANENMEVKSVELKLERGYGGLTVWNVKLFGTVQGRNPDEASLGSVIVLAEDGKVLKKDIPIK